ncbi:MAG: BON domain-containing protein [Roseimicrobium sp.]
MNPPPTPPIQVIKTHPYPIILSVMLGLLLLGYPPMRASDMGVENEEDASITTLVKRALLYHLSLNFKVETHLGVVTLSGCADNVAELELNARLAAEIVGVKRVLNHMSIPLTLAENH